MLTIKTTEEDILTVTIIGQTSFCKNKYHGWDVFVNARRWNHYWEEFKVGTYSDYEQACSAAIKLQSFFIEGWDNNDGINGFFYMPKNNPSLTKKVSFVIDFYLKDLEGKLDKHFAGRFEFMKRLEEIDINMELRELSNTLDTIAELYNIDVKEKIHHEEIKKDLLYGINKSYDLEKQTFESCFTEIIDILDLHCDDIERLIIYNVME